MRSLSFVTGWGPLVVVAAYAVLSLLDGEPALAQWFPPGPSIEELEESVARAEQVAEERAREDARRELLAEASEGRWDAMADRREEVQEETLDLADSGESRRILQLLDAEKAWWRLGIIHYYKGQDSIALQFANRSLSDEAGEWPTIRGHTHTLFVRARLLSRFNGEEWERNQSRVEREIESGRRFLQQAEEDPGLRPRDRNHRERTFNEFREFLDGYVEAGERSYELLQAIQENPWDGDLVWELSRVYKDGLQMLMRQREWLVVLVEFFPHHPQVLNGRVYAELADGLVRMGYTENATMFLDDAPAFANLRRSQLAETRELLDAFAAGEDLTDEQREQLEERGYLVSARGDLFLSPIGEGVRGLNLERVFERSREEQEEILSRAHEHVEEYAGWIRGDAGLEDGD